MGLKTWRNGEEGDILKAIIEHNFKILGKYLPYHILCISSENRNLLTSDYLSENLIVFDTTKNEWLQYKNGKWIAFDFGNLGLHYIKIFSKKDWSAQNEISIPFHLHKRENPVVQLYLRQGSFYCSDVFGGVYIDDNYNITLSTDLPFDGKVVIK